DRLHARGEGRAHFLEMQHAGHRSAFSATGVRAAPVSADLPRADIRGLEQYLRLPQHGFQLMKSYWVRHEGERSILEPREVAKPEPGPGQMVVRVRATALNRGDLMGAIAFHRSPGGRPAGVEAAGEVHAVGAGVNFTPGARVMTRGRGCFAEYVLVDPALAAAVPPHLSWEQAAAIPTAFVTAWEAMIQYGRIKAGEWMLVAGASSGVGVAALQIGKVMGVKVIGVSGSAPKLEKL